MLTLDEKKVRKGKPIGLPYQGSKKKISKKIIEIIKQNFGTDKPIYDIFGGGGAITAECLINGLEVHYNDLDETATSMFQKVVSKDRDYLKTLLVSRDEFLKIREKENKTVDDELKLLVNSFGNNRKGYLYSKEISDLKYNLVIEIIKNHDIFSSYRQTETYKMVTSGSDWDWFNEKLERARVLEQLQRLDQLERLQQLNGVKVTNKSYHDFSEVSGAILYLDPPYEGTSQDSYINSFDSQSFYNWAYEMSKKNIVLISSYEISDSRFECVYEFKNARSALCASGYGDKTEKLFMVKRG